LGQFLSLPITIGKKNSFSLPRYTSLRLAGSDSSVNRGQSHLAEITTNEEEVWVENKSKMIGRLQSTWRLCQGKWAWPGILTCPKQCFRNNAKLGSKLAGGIGKKNKKTKTVALWKHWKKIWWKIYLISI